MASNNTVRVYVFSLLLLGSSIFQQEIYVHLSCFNVFGMAECCKREPSERARKVTTPKGPAIQEKILTQREMQ